MTKAEKITLLENRLNSLRNNKKDNTPIQNKLVRQLRNLKNS